MALPLALVACAEFEPFDPPVAGELDERPGLVSGESGVFVLRPFERNAEAEPVAARPLTAPPPP
jgi:hypothetical protein